MSNVTDCNSTDWYALYVRHQHEYKISRLLRERLGIESLVPSRKIWKKKGGRVEVFKKPLLGAYVFYRKNLEAIDWRLLYTIQGIISPVRFGGAPAAIPDEQVTSVEKLGDSGAMIHEMEHRKLKPSDRVEVIDGPLKGAIGYFLQTNIDTGNFMVSVDLFQRSLVTEVDPGYIRAY